MTVKLYKSKEKVYIKAQQDWGSAVYEKECYLYVYIYHDMALISLYHIELDLFSITNNELHTVNSNAKGYIKGDFKEDFLIAFKNLNWRLNFFNHKKTEYIGLTFSGMEGKCIDNKLFKATFFTPFGEILFEENIFQLIEEFFFSHKSNI